MKAFRGLIDKVLGLLLGTMGLQSCLYAPAPSSFVKIDGEVINEQQQPIANAKVSIKPYHFWVKDTLHTDCRGVFQYNDSDMELDSLFIVAEDPAGVYQTDSASIELNYVGGTRHRGKGSAEDHVTITLKK